MKTWPNVNNSKDYCPYFILFLDCVSQFVRMNPSQFEFTNNYLVSIAFKCFTNKYFETATPILVTDTSSSQKFLNNEIKLISMFQPSIDSKNNNYLNQMFQTFGAPNSKPYFNID